MEDCKSCRVPLGFLSFSDPLPQSPHASYSIDSSEDEPEPIPIDSALVQAAFRRGLGNSGLALETADFKQDGVSQVEIVHTGSRYGIPQPNCLAVGITNGIRGAVIGSVFGGAMGMFIVSFRFLQSLSSRMPTTKPDVRTLVREIIHVICFSY